MKIRSYKGVAAFYVVLEVGQDSFLEEGEGLSDGLFILTLEDLQEKGDLCPLHCLPVYIHTVDIIEEYPLLIPCRKPPLSAGPLIDYGIFPPGMFFRTILPVPFQMPFKEVLVGTDEKGARTAGRIKDSQSLNLPGC